MNRIIWIDYSKAILILLVIIGHNNHNNYLDTIITSFHMPAFFYLSGILHKSPTILNYTNIKKYIVKQVNRLLVPVVFFNILGYLFWFIKSALNHSLIFTFKELLIKPIVGILIYSDLGNPMCLPMWFCITLFCIKIIILFFYPSRKRIISIIVLSYIIMYILISIDFTGRDFIGRIFLSLPFYAIGILTAKITNKIDHIKLSTKIFSLLAICIIWIPLSLWNTRCGILNFCFGKSIVVFILTSILGTLSTIIFTSFIHIKNKAITFISNGTLTILGTHLLILGTFTNNFKDYTIISSIVCLLISCIFIYIFDKFIPKLVGK